MPSPIFIRRVVLQNYLSIAKCSVSLGPLTFLVGHNGSGKSNFLDALRFVTDALFSSPEHALRDRGGIGEVRRRSSGHPTHFGIRLDFDLGDHLSGYYAFRIGAKAGAGFDIQKESCSIGLDHFTVKSGKVVSTSLSSPPAALPDRLFLVNASGRSEFRPLYDALIHMGFYNLNPDVIRELQSPDPGDLLAQDGRNLASLVKRLQAEHPETHSRVVELLGKVVPGVTNVEHEQLGKKETLRFRQKVGSNKASWPFPAENMSDGTLRALGVLVALAQPPVAPHKVIRLVGIEEPETALHPGAASVLRSALLSASLRTQVIVTSHSPDLLDVKEIQASSLLSVTSRNGETIIGPVDDASRSALRDRLYTAGELLRLNQLDPDTLFIDSIPNPQLDLFASDPEP
jgi:predicted ATPase